MEESKKREIIEEIARLFKKESGVPKISSMALHPIVQRWIDFDIFHFDFASGISLKGYFSTRYEFKIIANNKLIGAIVCTLINKDGEFADWEPR